MSCVQGRKTAGKHEKDECFISAFSGKTEMTISPNQMRQSGFGTTDSFKHMCIRSMSCNPFLCLQFTLSGQIYNMIKTKFV